MRQHDCEFVAAVAREKIGRTQCLAHRTAELRQNDIADHVSEGVVDLFEIVDIEHQQRDRQVVDARALDLLRQLPAKVAAIPDAGEIVGLGETHDPLARREIAEEERELRRENREELFLIVVERRLIAIDQQQSRHAAVDLHERVNRLAQCDRRRAARRQVVHFRFHDDVGGLERNVGQPVLLSIL